MRNRAQIIDAAIKYMEGLLGLDYSKTYRYRWYKGGSTDCSGFVYGAYLAAGFPLLVDGVERSTSTYEVYADGFDLIFPTSRDIIGKTFAPKGFYKSFDFQKGDLIFYSFGTTLRSNKITHVAMVYDESHIIQTANNKDKASIAELSYGDGRIVAVTRLNANATERERKTVRKSTADRIIIRRMQALLNTYEEKLNCDGIWGSKTEAALKDFQRDHNLTADGVCGELTWPALLGEAEQEELPEYVFFRNMSYGDRGEDVRQLQAMLNEQSFYAGELNGVFESKTKNAVRAAQHKHHLTKDGIAGRKTITALGGQWGYYPIGEIEVCTFNIKRGTYKNGTYKKIAEIIKGAHIVGLQEVTPAGLKKIASYAGMTSYMCETISGYGHAILTNFSVDDEKITTLSGSGERRKLHHLQSGDVSIYNVHLHYTEPTNTKQLKQVADILAKDESRIVILTGDFNRQDYDYLVGKGFIQTNKGQLIRNTEGGSSIVNKIDQVFLKGTVAKDIYKYEAVKKNESDHDALFVEVGL